MRIFSFFKQRPDELILTRQVLIEKWFEGGGDVIESLTKLILTRVAPALKKAMEDAGFETVQIRNEHWDVKMLSHKKLLSGKSSSDFNHLPIEYCWKIDSFESYSRWAERTEKMVEKINEIKHQVEEMKRRRDSIQKSVEIIDGETK